MSHEKDLEKWTPIALALPPEAAQPELRQPRAIFLREASVTTEYVDSYWESSDTSFPQFKEEDPAQQQFTREIIVEVDELRRASYQAEYNRQAAIDPKRPEGLVDEAIEVIDEIATASGYVLDDDLEEPADEQFARLQEARSDEPNNIANLIEQLFQLSTFGRSIADKLSRLGRDFDMGLLERALVLSELLAKFPAGPAQTSVESKKWLDRRNRILSLISQRVQLIQKVARFKFRNHPDIKQKFSSDYERRRNLASLKKKLAASQQQQQAAQQAEIERKKAEIRERLLEEQLTAEVKAELAQEKSK